MSTKITSHSANQPDRSEYSTGLQNKGNSQSEASLSNVQVDPFNLDVQIISEANLEAKRPPAAGSLRQSSEII